MLGQTKNMQATSQHFKFINIDLCAYTLFFLGFDCADGQGLDPEEFQPVHQQRTFVEQRYVVFV
jgi:hypothetical protein